MTCDAAHLFLLKPISCSCWSKSSLTLGSTCSEHRVSLQVGLVLQVSRLAAPNAAANNLTGAICGISLYALTSGASSAELDFLGVSSCSALTCFISASVSIGAAASFVCNKHMHFYLHACFLFAGASRHDRLFKIVANKC